VDSRADCHAVPCCCRFVTCPVPHHQIASYLNRLTSDLEAAAYPALDALTSRVTSHNLERVRRIKSRLVRLTTRVENVSAARLLGGVGCRVQANKGCAGKAACCLVLCVSACMCRHRLWVARVSALDVVVSAVDC
jgi:hypothetical protein